MAGIVEKLAEVGIEDGKKEEADVVEEEEEGGEGEEEEEEGKAPATGSNGTIAQAPSSGGVGGGYRKKGKKKGKRGAKAAAAAAAAAAAGGAASNGGDQIAQPLRQEQLKEMQRGQLREMQRRREKQPEKEHKFWNTQPVPQLGETPETSGEIDTKTIEDIRDTPYNMPSGFEWSDMDVNSKEEMQEVYTLLSENYVEDNDNMFRFDYSADFLLWALTPPGFRKDFHVGVRSSKTGKLMGFITGIPAIMKVHGTEIKTVEINFLCVHKRLRSKRLAPVLIKEITRRVNRQGVWQAVYTAGVVLPKPVSSCRYYHRSINPKKLIDVGFSRLPPRMTMARQIKLYKLPDKPVTTIRPMTKEDVPGVHSLLMEYLSKFKLSPLMDEEEIAHWLLPRKGVVDSFVVASADGTVTDMCSFYHLPSSIIGHPTYTTLNAAYAFYNVATTLPLADLMQDALVLGRDEGMDVFNALNLQDNLDYLEALKFGIGDGHLQYYLYNWACPEMKHNEVGLVLL